MSKKISAFTELAAQPATTDLFLLELASSGAYRKIKWSNLVADTSVTTAKLATGAVTTAKIATDAVTATKIDWASTGADGGIWWEELGRTTLGSTADTIAVSSFGARKYLQVLFMPIDSGQLNVTMTFNSDTGSNYATRSSDNGAADGSAVSQANIAIIGAATVRPTFCKFDIINIATYPKMGYGFRLDQTASGAGTAPSKTEMSFKWHNTSNQITTITLTNGGTGDFASGTELVVLGHN